MVVIAPPGEDELRNARSASAELPTLEEAIVEGLASGEPKSALAKALAKRYGIPRAQVYECVLRAASGS